MTVYVIVQLKMTDRAACDRYQARFFDVFKKFNGRLLSADENPEVLEGNWDRDKLVRCRFPMKQRSATGQIRRNIWRFQKTAKPARTESCCWRKDLRRKAGSSAGHHHGPQPNPKNGTNGKNGPGP
jgi:uncharacterized protein (DUF1330 family)